jgi:hypothetical protein
MQLTSVAALPREGDGETSRETAAAEFEGDGG